MKVWVYAELNTLINIQDRLEPDTHLLDHLSVLTGNTVGHCITRERVLCTGCTHHMSDTASHASCRYCIWPVQQQIKLN